MPTARRAFYKSSRSSSRFSRAGRATILGIFAGIPLAAAGVVAVSYVAFAAVPPVPVPIENPISEAKRVLGKIIFFDEQLSTSNTVACATCHTMSQGGADLRQARNPGVDGVLNTPDDMIASPGVIRSNSDNNFLRDTIYALQPQVTGRAAPSPINAAYSIDLFWDGRARSQFVDPQTGTVAIASGGALESQCVGPPTNSVEMAHDGMTWGQIASRLGAVNPLDLATNLPADVAAALADKPDYGVLFQRAFGDTAITSKRVAFAVAAYERTLISDQTPWDRFQAGQQNALTQGQIAGMGTFQQNCAVCHTTNQPGPNQGMFTDQTFRNIGLRPPAEDLGRQIVTGNTADRGKFKVPSLRNIGLHHSFMHNGMFSNMTDVVRFYVGAPGAPQQFNDNKDPAINAIAFPPQAEPALVDFVVNALTDPRVANQQFPFDRPTLFTERPQDRATLVGGGVTGSGGVLPRILVPGPPMVGNSDYRVGLDGSLGGASGSLWMSTTPPVSGHITQDTLISSVVGSGSGAGNGLATAHWPLTPGAYHGGDVLYVQWFVSDPGAVGGQAQSAVARVPIFCGSGGCVTTCGTADFNCDGDVGTDSDIESFFACLAGNCPAAPCTNRADFNGDGDTGTDSDIESFFRVLSGGAC